MHQIGDDEMHLDNENTVSPNRQLSEEADGHVGGHLKALAKRLADLSSCRRKH